ncbi:hypothetical protein A9Z61_03195 [Moraxella osloensis]|nr:hypothetical protein [Moraxella osloensis]OBX58362.1 hypothetical protein A9Z61_03195 [Moraxella osloensis]
MNILNRLPNIFLLLLFAIILFLKLLLFILVNSGLLEVGLSGGDDSDYYDAYALGYVDLAVNIWPVILRFFNDLGFYSRDGISYFFIFLNLFFIPILVAKLSDLSFKFNQKHYLYCLLICLIYPTLFFFTFDIYRDVFMVLTFLVGCLIVKKCLSRSNFISFSYFYILAILIGFFLLALRPYLGYAFLLALVLWKIKFTKKRIIFLFMLYLVTLFTANYMGYLDRLTDYRAGFEEGYGGSTLGLDFSNPVMFIPNFILSALGQLFGLYITNPLAIVLLLVETFPFVFMLKYVIKNIRLADSFIRFLLIFFVIYGSVWLIGNDNLGTAVRLRMYNYFAIYISFFYILNLKRQQGIK